MTDETPRDIHREKAAELFGVPVDQVTDAQRRVGKTANFMEIYSPAEPLLDVVRRMQEERKAQASPLFAAPYGRCDRSGQVTPLSKVVWFGQRYGQSGPPREPRHEDWARQELAALQIQSTMNPLSDIVRRMAAQILGPGKLKAEEFAMPEIKAQPRSVVFDFGFTSQAYRPGTTLHQIIEDGWSRGFHPGQTLREARGMGFVVSEEWILAHWRKMDRTFDQAMRRPDEVPDKTTFT